MALATPTSKQEEVLRVLVNCESLGLGQWLQAPGSGWQPAFDDHDVSWLLGITKQAAIARLSGLRRAGWVRFEDDDYEFGWFLTPAGTAGAQFFLDNGDQ